MTKQERERFLADLHVGIISIPEEGRGPLTVPIWYSYEPGGELRVVTARTSRKAQLLRKARRISLCVQTETQPYKYVSVEGPVVGIESADLERDERPLAHRYLGTRKGDCISTRHAKIRDTLRTCLSVCVPSVGSQWTTRSTPSRAVRDIRDERVRSSDEVGPLSSLD